MDFSGEAATWDDRPDRVARSRAVADAIRAAVDLDDHPATLELGAGTGLLCRQLADTLGPVTLTDSAPGMVQVARARIAELHLTAWRAELVGAQETALPGGPYGLVLSQLALHHMADVAGALRAAYDVLARGGRIALVDLDHDPDGAFHAQHADFEGPNGFPRADIVAWLTHAGFVGVRITTATVVDKVVRDETRAFPLFLATAQRPA